MVKQIITDGAELKLASTLREINTKYAYLNDGGCVHIAKWIGEAFLNKSIKVEYLILDNISEDVAKLLRPDFKRYANDESLGDLSERMIEVSHVLPLINNRLFVDSKGVHASFESTSWTHLSQMGYITHETLERWAKDSYYRWNPMFIHEHGHQMLQIEKEIKDLIKSLRI